MPAIDPTQLQPFSKNSGATTNATLVNAGKTWLGSLVAANNGAAAAFLKLYDKASLPVPGTDTPLMVIPIAPHSNAPLQVVFGMTFVLGFGYAITNLETDADATAVAAGQVKVAGNFIGV